jgi:hypothetical protein
MKHPKVSEMVLDFAGDFINAGTTREQLPIFDFQFPIGCKSLNRQSAIGNRQSAIGNRQSAIGNCLVGGGQEIMRP